MFYKTGVLAVQTKNRSLTASEIVPQSYSIPLPELNLTDFTEVKES